MAKSYKNTVADLSEAKACLCYDTVDEKGRSSKLKTDSKILLNTIDALPYYVMLVDEDHKIVLANKVMRDSLGMELKDLTNKYCPKIVHGTDRPFPGCPLEEVAIKGIAKERELYNAKTDTWMKSAVYPTNLKTLGGKKVYLHTAINITDEKKAQLGIKESLDKVKNTMHNVIDTMAKMVEARDPYTAGHQHRVSLLARAISVEMGFSERQIDAVSMAAAIHDIGKVQVPSEILSKPGRLSKAEFDLIKVHPQIGYEVLKSIDLPRPIGTAILQHHERLNGSGYPMAITEKKIIVEARILAVADVVEAMQSHRPYRPALGIEKALEEIEQNRGVLYDKNVVEACMNLFLKKLFKFKQDEDHWSI